MKGNKYNNDGGMFTYMLTSHTLADNLGVLVHEHVGFSTWSIHSSLGEGKER